MANKYQLLSGGGTTGVNSIGPDVNAYNGYGMTPVQVALQAGKPDELRKILANPLVESARKAAAGFGNGHFIEIYKVYGGKPEVAHEMSGILQTFTASQSTRAGRPAVSIAAPTFKPPTA